MGKTYLGLIMNGNLMERLSEGDADDNHQRKDQYPCRCLQ